MSKENSDSDLKAAQGAAGPVVIDGLSLFSAAGSPTCSGPATFTNLSFVALTGDAVTLGPLEIGDSPVSFTVAEGTEAEGSISASLTGRISALTMDDTGATGVTSFSTTMEGRVDEASFTLTSGGTSRLTTNQTTPLVINGLVPGNGVVQTTLTFEAVALTDLTFPESVCANYSVLTFGGAWNTATTNAILQAFVNGDTTSSIITTGGTSGAPSPIPELSQLTVSTPVSGDAFSLAGAWAVSMRFDASVAFAASSNGSEIIIGIADSPGTVAIASLLGSYFTEVGFEVSASGNVITFMESNSAAWPIDLEITAGPGTSLSLVTTRPGVDLLTALATLGNIVTTN